MVEPYNIKLILPFLILHVLVDLLEPSGERTPSLGMGIMPYQNIPLVGGGCN